MANAFKRESETAGTSATQMLSYTNNAVPASTEVVVIGLLASNKTTSTHYITVEIVNGSNTTTWIKDAPIPSGSSLSMMENKLVLVVGDKLQVTASAASSIDVTLSFLEIT
ncbi:MAG: hypothetical protein CBC12_10740 [Candidatus Puniceispirillum sp. TMED52]|nr:MAG: hypothetical protein CBC12_10740 [Candidatus Puniceispirillum sp. TMED52]|tara:strand:+ start:866 stop:1198 length:333 start_codon:yes stop_codon:yes gene_type:complete